MLSRIGRDFYKHATAVIRYLDLFSAGDHCAVDEYTVITTRATLENYIHIGPHCSIIGGRGASVVMQDCSGLSAGVRLVCCTDDFKGPYLIGPTIPLKYRNPKGETIMIERCAIVGTNAVVLPGVTLAEGSLVGACSLVAKDTKPWGIYIGIPAQFVGIRPQAPILAAMDDLLRGKSNNERGPDES